MNFQYPRISEQLVRKRHQRPPVFVVAHRRIGAKPLSALKPHKSKLKQAMKAILQRCLSASVTVDSKVVSSIGKGILVLAAVSPHDTVKEVEWMAAKILKMKMWPDDAGINWKNSVQEIDGEVLCVSQFTLYASTRKGNKPDFHGAAKPEVAKALYDHFVAHMKKLHGPSRVQDGVFQAMMDVALVNDGPVTLDIESGPQKRGLDISGTSTPVSKDTHTSGTSTPVSESVQ